MNMFEEKFKEVMLEEESRVIKTRKFYPRKIKTVGGFDRSFLRIFNKEVARLKELDPSITNEHILKSIDFELTK